MVSVFMAKRFCKGCSKLKDIDGFHKSTRDGTQYFCKECIKDYKNNWKRKQGKTMDTNRDCSAFLGIYVAENVLRKTFNSFIKMPNNNHGYDFICGKGYKIDVKASTLSKYNNCDLWQFRIRKNKIADYFLLLGFDNRKDLNPKHIWLVPGLFINNRITVSVSDNIKSLNKWTKYELRDKLEKTVLCCNKIKGL